MQLIPNIGLAKFKLHPTKKAQENPITSVLSNTQRYKSIGNGWCIDVIVHILKCMVDNN